MRCKDIKPEFKRETCWNRILSLDEHAFQSFNNLISYFNLATAFYSTCFETSNVHFLETVQTVSEIWHLPYGLRHYTVGRQPERPNRNIMDMANLGFLDPAVVADPAPWARGLTALRDILVRTMHLQVYGVGVEEPRSRNGCYMWKSLVTGHGAEHWGYLVATK